jgi:hypothetical protein
MSHWHPACVMVFILQFKERSTFSKQKFIWDSNVWQDENVGCEQVRGI